MKVTIMEYTPFLKKDGTFDLAKAILESAKKAGICYNENGLEASLSEPEEDSLKRAKLTLNLEHHSVYDHVNLTLALSGVPKILAMILNNEKDYNTSERSARYTKIVKTEGSLITDKEEELYNKWLDKFNEIIKEKYSDVYNADKINKLAQENARYMVTVFMPTELVHTIPLAQLNKVVSFMKEINAKENKTAFEAKLAPYLTEFIKCLDDLNLTHEALQKNSKHRSLSLFDAEERKDSFDYTYNVTYEGSFASLAQAQRHRTLNYGFRFLENDKFFIPPIILDNEDLVTQWILDLHTVASVFPQGMLINISESGSLENFLLKCKERLCTNAQLEIANQTKNILVAYKAALESKNHPKAEYIAEYNKGARCTFPDYECQRDCKFGEGKRLVRKI